jgi:hypothetical protein
VNRGGEWSRPRPRPWLAYAPGYRRRQHPVSGIDGDTRWEMFLDDNRFYVNTNGSCVLVGDEDVSIWDGSNYRSGTEFWRGENMGRLSGHSDWSESEESPLSMTWGIQKMAESTEMIVYHVLWLLPIWLVFKTAWRQSQEKSILVRRDEKNWEVNKGKK